MNQPRKNASCSPLRYVACISYPRSGHHLTARVLRHYFQQQFKYCAYYNEADEECCHSYPCNDPTVTMTKNHDMDLNRRLTLGIPKLREIPYLILVRNFLEAVVSDYTLYLRRAEDSKKSWIEFSTRKKRFYQRFVDKWVLSQDNLEKLVVHYEQLTDDPVNVFRNMIAFFQPSDPIDQKRLEHLIETAVLEKANPTGIEVVRNFGVRNRRKIEEFKYFDPAYFADLESGLARQLEGMGYRLRYAA